MTLDPISEAVLEATTGRFRPAKIDAMACTLPMGVADPQVPLDETIRLAAAGAAIGTELPANQVI